MTDKQLRQNAEGFLQVPFFLPPFGGLLLPFFAKKKQKEAMLFH